MDNWTLWEMVVAAILVGAGGALRMLFTRVEKCEARISGLETRVAVVQESTTNIYHRLDRIEGKLDKLLERN